MTAHVRLVPFAALLLLAGCFGGAAHPQAAARRRAFLLAPAPAARLVPAPRFAAVKLRSCRALPPFDARAFIVRRAGGEVAEDYYNGWLVPPHDLLRGALARHLEQTGLFDAVYDGGSGTQTPLAVEAVVGDLSLDFSGERPAAAVSLRLLVLDDRAPGFAALFSEERSGRAPFDAADPAAPAEAFGRALTEALVALGRALAVAELPPAPGKAAR